MPTFRYHARQPTGVPVFGSQDADSESALRFSLAARGLELITSSQLSVNVTMRGAEIELPRLYQLRIGERLREAWLTGLPAQDAVRAMAAEPFEHPLLQFMPWAVFMAVCLLLPMVGWTLVAPGSELPAAITALFAFVILPACWLFLLERLDRRPRRMLHYLADQIESGNEPAMIRSVALPPEVRSVMESSIEDRKKALAASDLIPSLAGSRFHQHRFLMALVGSCSLIVVFFLGFYWVMWQVVPMFGKIFEDFGTELPAITQLVVTAAAMFKFGGAVGFFASCLASAAFLVLLYAGLSRGPIAELFSHTPILGVPIRWLMQARVARVLAAMLRHNCDRAESLRAATACSSFRDVRRDGEFLASSLRNGTYGSGFARALSGLPIALLAIRSPKSAAAYPISGQDDAPTDGSTTVDDAALAQNFSTMAQMLEQACQGHGMLLGVILQTTIAIAASLMTGLLIISLFMPLIKLLNDLA